MGRRSYGTGSIVERRKGVWRVRVPLPPDPVTGARRELTETVHGSKRAAQARLDEMRRQAGGGPAPASMTVGDMLERAMASIVLAPRTRENWETVIRLHIVPDLAALALRDLTAHRIDAHYATLRGRGLSAHRIRTVHDVLSACTGRAVRWGWLPASPTANASKPARPQKRSRAHPEHVITDLSIAAATHPTWGLWFRLASVTGARRGELAGITWADVDLDAAVMRVDRAVTAVRGAVSVKAVKTNERRDVPLDAETVAMLAQRRRQHLETLLALGLRFSPRRYVFTHRGSPVGDRPVRPDAATHWFTRMRDERGAAGVRLNDLRHLAASDMLAAGVEPHVVADMLGNSVETLMANYAHVLDGRKKAAADLMGEIVRRRLTVRATLSNS